MPEQTQAVQCEPRSSTGYVTRPGVVTYICVTAVIGAVVGALFSAPVVLNAWQTGDEESTYASIFVAVLLGLDLFVIYGLWTAKKWARIAFVILAVLSLALDLNPIRILILAVCCVFLFRKTATDYFNGIALPAIDPASGLELGNREIIRCPACNKELYSTLPRCHHCGAEMKPAA